MACGGCAKRRAAKAANRKSAHEGDLTAGYANLNNQQLKARLEVYKRRYCKTCDLRYKCDYAMYLDCKKAK